jgi:hypothetical protein
MKIYGRLEERPCSWGIHDIYVMVTAPHTCQNVTWGGACLFRKEMVITVSNLKATRLSRQVLILARIEKSVRVLIGIICNSRYVKGPTRDAGLKRSGMGAAEWKLPLPYQSSLL